MKNTSSLFSNNNNPAFLENAHKEHIKAMIKAIDIQSKLNGTSCFMIDYDKQELIYKTEYLIYVDAATDKDHKRDCVNPYWSIISDDTLSFLFSIHEAFMSINKEQFYKNCSSYIYIIDYPIIIRNKDFYISQKFTPLLLREDGTTKIGLFVITNSTKNQKECQIITSIGKKWNYDTIHGEFIESNLKVSLSLIEKSIFRRIQKGLTSLQIAEEMCISENTVKTHRSRVFKKLGVKSIMEALTIMNNYELI